MRCVGIYTKKDICLPYSSVRSTTVNSNCSRNFVTTTYQVTLTQYIVASDSVFGHQ